MPITLRKDLVLVEEFEEEEKPRAIILSEGSKPEKETAFAIVIEVGPYCEEVEKGDTVIFNKYIAEPFIYEDKKYLIISESEILCKQ